MSYINIYINIYTSIKIKFVQEVFICLQRNLEGTESLLSLDGTLGLVGDNIEPNSLTQRTALSDGYNITILYGEGWGAVSGNILVSLLKTTVLGNVVKVISPYNNCALHLGGANQSSKDTSTNGNVSSEGTLLVNKVSLNSTIGSLDSKSNLLDETHGFLTLSSNGTLTGDENGLLSLVGFLVLIALFVCSGYTGHFKKSCFVIQIKKKS